MMKNYKKILFIICILIIILGVVIFCRKPSYREIKEKVELTKYIVVYDLTTDEVLKKKIIRCVMLALYVVIIFIWEKAGIYVTAITLVWMGLAVFEYIYIIIFKQENEKIKIITIYGEDITQGAIKRYQGNKVQYKTIEEKTLILNLQDIKRIEYERPYWNERERKKLEKTEVKCELYNGNILAGNQVMILNEDWIRLEIQENTDILVKILKCKDVRKVETIHK